MPSRRPSTVFLSPRITRAPFLLAGMIVLLLTAGGCRFLARGPFAGRATAPDSVRADSALARDSLVRLDTVAVDSSLARAVRAAAAVDTAPPRPDSVPVDSTAIDSAGPDSAAADSLPEGERYTVEQLLEMGPTYTPYDVSPKLLPGDWLTDLLSDTLAPVVDRHDELSVQDVALFWVLVDRDGEVRDAVLHTTSDANAFDQAAQVVAERLRFRPAVADGEPVPVWVLKRVSLLMR